MPAAGIGNCYVVFRGQFQVHKMNWICQTSEHAKILRLNQLLVSERREKKGGDREAAYKVRPLRKIICENYSTHRLISIGQNNCLLTQLLNMGEQKLFMDEFPKRIQDNMRNLWREGNLLDFTIKVDGASFRVHKSLLATCSDYFKALFSNPSLESQQDEIPLFGHSAATIEAIIESFYSSEIAISNETVQEILLAASMLQTPDIIKLCVDYIESRIDTTNCLGVLSIAERCDPDLAEYALRYCLDKFELIIEGREFLELDEALLSKLISHDELNVDDELDVLRAIFKWVSFDRDSRISKMDSLIAHVRFVVVEPLKLISIKTHEILRISNFCRDLIEEAKDIYICSKECPDKKLDLKTSQQRVPLRAQQRIFAVGGWTDELKPVSSVEKYDPYQDEWIFVKPMSRPRCGVGVAFQGNSLYAFGGHDGQNYLKSVERYDISENCWYEDVVDMRFERTSIGIVALKNYIYAIGGQIGSNSTSIVERYDTKTNTWMERRSMSERRLGAGVAILNGLIYAVGGADIKALNTVEYYDPAKNKWTSVRPMNACRKHLGCASYNGKIFAVGGRDDSNELLSAECYDPISDEWKPLPDMNEKRSGIGLVECDGILYALGGQSGDKRLTLVEAYDIDRKVWTLKQSMNQERLGGGSALYSKVIFYK